MVQKRQLTEEEYDVSPKHLKLEHSRDLVPYLQFTKEDGSLRSDKYDGCFFKFVNDNLTDHSLASRLSTSSLTSTTTTEEDLKSETHVQISDPYSYFLEHSALKKVPIGPEYQAKIPEWREYDVGETKFMGSVVIPMPQDPTVHENNTFGGNKTGCYCANRGSRLCVQQHIEEETEKLKESIGHKTCAELGFCNMGELVAEEWSEEEEELFHEIVYSNPVSVGKNFWNLLETEFPSRTHGEIVSYYFNVFMLRKRAEQNRCDSMDADSDDDEWQGTGLSFESTSEQTDFQNDESCTSSDTAGPSEVKVNSNRSWVKNEFIFEALDSNVWDVGYFSCSRTKNDFLPTGSMIEEVFGDESWDFEA